MKILPMLRNNAKNLSKVGKAAKCQRNPIPVLKKCKNAENPLKSLQCQFVKMLLETPHKACAYINRKGKNASLCSA
jgi:hypothetical protein